MCRMKCLWATAMLALAACGGTAADRDAAGGESPEESGEFETAPGRDSQQVVTVDAEPESLDAGGLTTTGAASTSPTAIVPPADDAADVSPEDISTGPVLEWTELDLGLPYGRSVGATGDGRVVAMGGSVTDEFLPTDLRLLVTEDGVDWMQVSLPPEFFPLSVAMSEERIALSGYPVEDIDAGINEAQHGPPVFVSDDQGVTWTLATLDADAVADVLPDDATVEFGIATTYVSGDFVLAAVLGWVRLDIESLLVEADLVAADALVVGWESIEDSVVVWLDDGSGADTELQFAHDELALTDSQRALLGDARDNPLHGVRTFLFGGSTPQLSTVASFDGWARSGSATDDGFRLVLSSQEGDSLISSPRGVAWTTHDMARSLTEDIFHVDVFAEDGTVWSVQASVALESDSGASLHRWRVGEPASQAVHFPGIEALVDLAAGPAGLVVGGLRGLDSTDVDDVPEQWVGWSDDGVRWGWESARDAFGVGDAHAVARFAVGEDFVIALVWLIPPPEFSDAADTDRIPEMRWYIAQVP